jgi:alkanesulfonate monooxygenase SsuD/methylene tetrahydromethanopterin reductase-like flavin-dependent oxidoreductase (luciferase family)
MEVRAEASPHVMLRQSINMFIGTPEELVARIAEFAAAGADEVMLQWFALDDPRQAGSAASPTAGAARRPWL